MLTTHILDTALGKPAAQVKIIAEQQGANGQWQQVGEATTDPDGRAKDLVPGGLQKGPYRLTFAVAEYFQSAGRDSFYPEVTIAFQVKSSGEHYHVP